MNDELNIDLTFVRILHEKFKDILYRDDTHTYYNNGKKLISVTTSLNKFKKPFDKEYWLKVKAEQRGISVKELEQEWEDIKVKGLSKGTEYHNYIEKRLNREIFSYTIPEAEEFLKNDTDIPVLQEFIIGNDVIGGRFDYLSLRGNDLILRDFKTNKKFEKESNYFLINGLEHLPATEYYIYGLQMSLYQYILDLPITARELIWFNEGTYKVISVPYFKKEAEYIIDYIRNENS